MAAMGPVCSSSVLPLTMLTPPPSEPYPYIVKNMVALLGDAGHPVRFPLPGCSSQNVSSVERLYY